MSSQAIMTTAVENNGLATREEFSAELQTSAASAEKQHEIQSAIVLARRFPRDEDQAFAKLMKACQRTSFAETSEYSFPRGKKQDERGQWIQNYVKGPSVNVAREAARVWGNIRYGIDVIRDDGENRSIRGWAWDLETNVKVQADDDFKKVVFKKGYNGAEGKWNPADERELRELTNRRGAILVRNCILQILPKDLIEDALTQAHTTLTERAKQDPEGEKKRIIMAFSELSVTPEMLGQYLNHPLAQSSPTEIADLRGIYKSIKDGHSTWNEYVNPTPEERAEDLKDKTKNSAEKLKAKLEETAAVSDAVVAPEVTSEPPPDTDEDAERSAIEAEETSPLESLRANVQAKFEEFSTKQQKDLIAGKPAIKDMNEVELTEFAVVLNQA